MELEAISSLIPSGQQIAVTATSGGVARRLPLPWADPHSVSPEELQLYISSLERASEKNPQCSELRTCLGIAHAMNYDVYKSIDALEAAVEIDPRSFIAQYKYTELLYRLRILVRAKQEGIKAANLASNAFELAMAQKLLQEVRRLMREGSQKPEWSKPLFVPSLALVLVFVLASFLMYFKP